MFAWNENTILIQLLSNFGDKSCNICRIWGCDLHYFSNSALYGSPQCTQNI